MVDRVGIGWRRLLAAGIVANLDHIDAVELIADDYFDARRADLRALRTLAAQVPILLHGVSLGLASASPVATRPLERMARLVDDLRPERWSEHLAFVRGGGLEIGHLAAPPRTAATVEGACRNAERARRVVGTSPELENIATLIDPPGSALDEASWISAIMAGSGCDLLLDLHNLYANALNFGGDPVTALDRLPLDRVATIHIAGGRWTRGRLLDDHLHAVPAPVYEMLTEVARRSSRPLTVILERDGRFPPFEMLLDEMRRAREALHRGRTVALERVA